MCREVPEPDDYSKVRYSEEVEWGKGLEDGMTTDEAQGAHVMLSEVMVLLSSNTPVMLNKSDLDWLCRIHSLMPRMPLPDGPYDVVAVPRVFGEP